MYVLFLLFIFGIGSHNGRGVRRRSFGSLKKTLSQEDRRGVVILSVSEESSYLSSPKSFIGDPDLISKHTSKLSGFPQSLGMT